MKVEQILSTMNY